MHLALYNYYCYDAKAVYLNFMLIDLHLYTSIYIYIYVIIAMMIIVVVLYTR